MATQASLVPVVTTAKIIYRAYQLGAAFVYAARAATCSNSPRR